jgi:hypothetical protein
MAKAKTFLKNSKTKWGKLELETHFAMGLQ